MAVPPVGVGAESKREVVVETDTIVAVSTAVGPGAIGIVRMSGAEAISIAACAFRAQNSRDLRGVETFSLTYGHVVDPVSGRVLDEVLIGVMRGPRSYTREDVVEFHCHGGVLAVRHVLDLLVGLGARVADPGEFTRRAFANGRIDLAQAESVAAVVSARSTGALRASLQQLGGGLSQRLSGVRRTLVETLVPIEANVDFSEEDIEEIDWRATRDVLVRAQKGLAELLSTAMLGRALEYGVRVAIVGKPNAGKSSLLNALVMRERAIVSGAPGTTRDTVEDEVEIGGLAVRFVDTAGLRPGGDDIERMGVERSLEALEQADVVMIVVDLTDPDCAAATELARQARGRARVMVGNKADIVGSESGPYRELVDAAKGLAEPDPDRDAAAGNAGVWVREVSALTGEGIGELRQVLGEVVSGGHVDVEEPILVGERQRRLVAEAESCVRHAVAGIDSGEGAELIAEDVRAAAEDLGRITGEELAPELLDEIFGRFCVGK